MVRCLLYSPSFLYPLKPALLHPGWKRFKKRRKTASDNIYDIIYFPPSSAAKLDRWSKVEAYRWSSFSPP